MNAETFPYDVFLSHSAKDKAVVRPLAERFRQDGLKVWFDEWVLKPGDSIPAKIEAGPSDFGLRMSDFLLPWGSTQVRRYGPTIAPATTPPRNSPSASRTRPTASRRTWVFRASCCRFT